MTPAQLQLSRISRIVRLLAVIACFAGFLPSDLVPVAHAQAVLLTSGLQGTIGSTIGPDGALYVAEGGAGKITRVDPNTGVKTTFASGLPAANPAVGIGGPMDVEFLDNEAYVLIGLVSPDFGGTDVDGIYRIDGPSTYTIIADIGQFAIDNPPDTDFMAPTGVPYALDVVRGAFLVTDGHHNRIYKVTLDGNVSVVKAFVNIVPTGLAVWGSRIYMAEAGPVPHLPENGKVVSFSLNSASVNDVASGAPLLVDVTFGLDGQLFALSQGQYGGGPAGSPALPNTGKFVKVNRNGTFTVLADHLNLPTSVQIIGGDAYVVNLLGEVWKIANVSNPPFGTSL